MFNPALRVAVDVGSLPFLVLPRLERVAGELDEGVQARKLAGPRMGRRHSGPRGGRRASGDASPQALWHREVAALPFLVLPSLERAAEGLYQEVQARKVAGAARPPAAPRKKKGSLKAREPWG